MIEVRVFVDDRAEVGEGPVWLPDGRGLVWVDMTRGSIHVSSYPDGATTTTRPVEFVGAAAPRSTGGQVIGTLTGFALRDADGDITASFDLLPDGERMNDGKCDPLGRFWSGSTAMDFAPGAGRLHVLDAHGAVVTVLDGLTLPNGLDWSPDGTMFYLADSVAHELLAFDCDLNAPSLTGRRVLHAFSDEDGMPDGLCVDADGRIWVALWGGSAVVCLSPDGERLRTIPVPARQTSSCAFGGDDLDILFVTSAAAGLVRRADVYDGAVFAVAGTGSRGRPTTPFAG
jgi:sugar lactone lactonase YvrE